MARVRARARVRVRIGVSLMFMAVQSVAALCGGGLARVVMDSSDSPIGYRTP